VHQRGRRLGLAVNQLSQGDGGPGAHTRFVAVATASTWAQRLFHLRGLVALMRSHGVSLDYAELACDLYLLQRPGRADSVRLQWGRDRYGGSGPSNDDTTQPSPDSPDRADTTDTTAEEA
jgi:CRISPR system Cascade subunit CasB